MSKRIPIGELLRLACVYAENYQLDFADAVSRSDPSVAKEAREFVKQLQKYRVGRWGKTTLEKALANGKPMSHDELVAAKEPTP